MIHICKCLSFPRKRESRINTNWIPDQVGNDRKKTTKKDGVILLLVVIMLTAIFSISIGVFSVIIGQISISETFENSGIALYAADQGNERALYRDRIENDFPCASPPCTTEVARVTTASGGCMSATTIIKTAVPTTSISTRGLSTSCGTVTERTIARAFLTTY